MISRVLILAVLLYSLSFFTLLRNRRRSGIVRFLYLFWLHLLVGSGYLFIAVYRHWDFGERYDRYAHVDISNITIYYILLACLLLSVLTRTRHLFPPGDNTQMHNEQAYMKLKPFSLYDLILIALFVFLYSLGLELGTLSTAPISLPFRLNGIVELSLMLLIPIYISLRAINYRHSFWISLSIITGYSIVNIVSFGSKGPAVYPIVVFISVTMAMKPLKITQILIPSLLILSLYAIFNPNYFRESLLNEESLSMTEKLNNSVQGTYLSRRRMLLGTRNLAIRITGIIPMQFAVDDSVALLDSTRSARIDLRVGKYYNEEIRHSPQGTSDAAGHFGCFMFMFHNHPIGFIAGCLVFIVFFRIACYFDYLAHRDNIFYPIIQGIFFVMSALGFMVDGNYDKSSGYLKMVFGLIVVGEMARELLGEKGVLRKGKEDRTNSS